MYVPMYVSICDNENKPWPALVLQIWYCAYAHAECPCETPFWQTSMSARFYSGRCISSPGDVVMPSGSFTEDRRFEFRPGSEVLGFFTTYVLHSCQVPRLFSCCFSFCLNINLNKFKTTSYWTYTQPQKGSYWELDKLP
jgi:hypothetical protein